MESILQERGAAAVEILKIDIEGAELTTLDSFLDTYKPAQVSRLMLIGNERLSDYG